MIHSDLSVNVLCTRLVFSMEGQSFNSLADFVESKETGPIGEVHYGMRSATGAYSGVVNLPSLTDLHPRALHGLLSRVV